VKKRVTFGQWLHTYRTSGRMTLQDVADKAGTCKSYIHDLENGKCEPSVDILFRIAKAFKIRPSVIVAQIE
jgi:transcriptional regulator with XRE-family HTH domain